MEDSKNQNNNTPSSNPAKGVKTPSMPTISTRGDGKGTLIHSPKGSKK